MCCKQLCSSLVCGLFCVWCGIALQCVRSLTKLDLSSDPGYSSNQLGHKGAEAVAELLSKQPKYQTQFLLLPSEKTTTADARTDDEVVRMAFEDGIFRDDDGGGDGGSSVQQKDEFLSLDLSPSRQQIREEGAVVFEGLRELVLSNVGHLGWTALAKQGFATNSSLRTLDMSGILA